MKKVESGTRGQKIWSEAMRVNEPSFKNRDGTTEGGENNDEALMGRSMGGGPLDLSATISGGDKDAEGKIENTGPKPRKPGGGAF